MNKLILLTVIVTVLISSVLLVLPEEKERSLRTIDAITQSPMPQYAYSDQHRANYELIQLYSSGSKNKLLEWESSKLLEAEQRQIESKRKNWKRYINGEYIFGYDERYDPKVYDLS